MDEDATITLEAELADALEDTGCMDVAVLVPAAEEDVTAWDVAEDVATIMEDGAMEEEVTPPEELEELEEDDEEDDDDDDDDDDEAADGSTHTCARHTRPSSHWPALHAGWQRLSSWLQP